MTGSIVRVSPQWLHLREAADAAARAGALVDDLRCCLPPGGLVVHDLGSGTGSMTRWLAPRLPGPQRWVLHDLDPDLLELAVARVGAGARAAAGAPVTCVGRVDDVTRLLPEDLADADLVTCSALLDVLTDDELERLLAVCAAAGCPLLLTLTVVGSVALAPPDPLDEQVAAAFDAHQRRPRRGGRSLGPDALDAAVRQLRAAGLDVRVAPSPWRLGAGSAELVGQWCTGWVEAAREQAPALGPALDAYLARRRRQARAGALHATVAHGDLLALPEAAVPVR